MVIAVVKSATDDGFGSGFAPFVEFFEDAIKFQDREIFIEVVVDLHRRSAGTRADAFDFFQRKHAVLGGFLVADFEALLGPFKNVVAAAEHAGDVGANLDMVLAHRFAAEHRVVGKRFFDLNGVKFEAFRDFRDHFVADATELILRVHHHGMSALRLTGYAFCSLSNLAAS